MIPKIIHLCWLSGDPYPPKIAKCLETWKKHLVDYEIILWDTNRFDLNIYLDSDVEVLKNFDDLLDLPYFMGVEKAQTPEAAIIGAEKGCDWIKMCLDYYKDRPFVNEDGSLNIQTVPAIMIRQIEQIKPVRVLSLEESLNIRNLDMQKEVLEFNDVFFSPKVFDSREVEITPYTYAIHHYQNSWFSHKAKAYYRTRAFLVKMFGQKLVRKAELMLMPWKFKSN